jgi:hypothetical protein
MKITESTLRRIIREEMAALAEGRYDRGTGTMWDPTADRYGRGDGDYPEGGSDEYEREPGSGNSKVDSLVHIFKQEHRYWSTDYQSLREIEFEMERLNRDNALGASPEVLKQASRYLLDLVQNANLPSWADTRRRRSRY